MSVAKNAFFIDYHTPLCLNNSQNNLIITTFLLVDSCTFAEDFMRPERIINSIIFYIIFYI